MIVGRERYMQIPALFLIGFVILYARTFCDMTTLFSIPDQVDKLMLLAGSVFLLLHCCKNIGRYKGLVLPLLLALTVGVYVYFAAGETAPFVFILVAASAPTAADGRSLIRMWLQMTATLVLFLCIVYVIVLLVDPSGLDFVYRDGGEDTERIRYSFYFNHPNMVAALWLMIICAYLYLKSGKISGVAIVGVLLLSTTIFALADSRTSFILSCLAPLLCYCQQKWGFLGLKVVKRVLYLLPLLLFLFVFLSSSVLYSNDIADWFTGRIWLWHVCYENQGITLLGQRFEEAIALTSEGYRSVASTLDSFYASGLFAFGLAFCLVFCLFYWSTLSSIKNPHSLRYCVLTLMLVFGLTEVHILSIVISPGLLLMGLGIESRLARVPSAVEAGRAESKVRNAMTSTPLSRLLPSRLEGLKVK